MKESSKLWIDAACILATNPNAVVACPACKTGTLTVVKDESFGEDKIDRYICCDSCERHNVLTIVTRTFIDEVDEEDDPFE